MSNAEVYCSICWQCVPDCQYTGEVYSGMLWQYRLCQALPISEQVVEGPYWKFSSLAIHNPGFKDLKFIDAVKDDHTKKLTTAFPATWKEDAIDEWSLQFNVLGLNENQILCRILQRKWSHLSRCSKRFLSANRIAR